MRLFLFFILIMSHLSAITLTPVHTTVSSIDTDAELVTISTPEQAQVGMFGLIVHWFDATHSVALSWVEVKTVQSETSTLSMLPIYSLEQSALPSGTWTPKVGDEVILGYNYHRALLIAPNPNVYKKVTAYHSERTWVHPDIFTTVLSSNGHPSPLKEDFTATCRANNIGIVAFAFDSSLVTVDCQSFKILENKSTILKSDEVQLPFYSRVAHIEANWFGEGSDELEEYSPYYVGLLAENNPENQWIQDYKTAQEATREKDSGWFDFFSDEIETETEDNNDSNVSTKE